MIDKDTLPAISDMMDNKLVPIKTEIKVRVTGIELTIENEIQPNVRLLAENYVPAARRYAVNTEKFEKSDVDLLKKVVGEHSARLQQIL